MRAPLTNPIVRFLRQRFLCKAETLPHSLAAPTTNLGIDHARTALACKSFALNPVKATACDSLCVICPLTVTSGLFYVLLEAGVADGGS